MTSTSFALALSWSLVAAWPAASQETTPRAAIDVRANATAKFKAADRNGDGFIDAAEIAAVAAEDFRLLDRDGKGVLTVPRACRYRSAARSAECEIAAFDLNRDLSVTVADHHRAMRGRIMDADTDRDGKISLDEYLAWSMKRARPNGNAYR